MKRLVALLLLLITITIGATACHKNVSFDISFVVDGVVVDSIEIKKGEALPDVLIPIKEGHTFSGWYYEENFSTRYIASAKIIEETTFYGKFTLNQYDITFVVEGSENIIKKVDHGATLTDLPTVPTKEGQTGEWDTTNFVNITQSKTVTAIYTHYPVTIIFKAEGMADIKRTIAYGATLTDIPAVPTKIGKDGVWDNTSFDNITQNKTINAVYTDMILEITFLSALGDESFEEIKYVTYGQSLPIEERPLQPQPYEGHTGSWESASFDDITENFIVRARYIPHMYEVLFVGFKDNETLTVPYGTILATYILESELAQDDKDNLLVEEKLKEKMEQQITDAGISIDRCHNFRYGNDDSDINTPIKQNQSFEIIYDETVHVTIHVVQYSGNGESEYTIKVDEGHNIEMLAGKDISNYDLVDIYGFEFLGWYDTSECTESININEPIFQDRKIYAVWKELYYKIAFPAIEGIIFDHEYNGPIKFGERFSFAVSSTIGDILEIKSNAFTLEENNNLYTISDIQEDQNLAIRTENINIFTLKFYNDKEQLELLFARNVSEGLTLQTVPAVPKIVGATGIWIVGNEDFDETKPITRDIELVTKYVFTNYSVTYNLGDTMEYDSITYGTEDFELFSPERKEGKLFDGWYANASLEGERVTRKYIAYLGKPISLYPKWINEKDIVHEALGVWSTNGLIVQLNSNGMVQISDAISFGTINSKVAYLECSFDIVGNDISIFEEIAIYDGTNLKFRSQTLVKAKNSITLVEFKNFELNDGTKVITVEDNLIPQRNEFENSYWYTDSNFMERLDITKPLNMSTISNNILRLYKSETKKIRLNFNPGESVMNGNVQLQDIRLSSYLFIGEEMFQPMPTEGREFVGWVLEGTSTVVDKAYLFSTSEEELNLVAIYIDTSHSPEQTIDGEYSVVVDDEMIIAKFDPNGTYQLIFIDMISNTYTKRISSLYYGEVGGYTDANSDVIEVGETLTMFIDNVSMTLHKKELTLANNKIIYQNTDEDAEVQIIEFSEYGMIIDSFPPVLAYQNGDYFYYFSNKNGVQVLKFIDINMFEKIEVIIPEKFFGEYEGEWTYSNPENNETSIIEFIMYITASCTNKINLVGMEPMDIDIRYDEESDKCFIETMNWSLYIEGGEYIITSDNSEFDFTFTNAD